MKVENELLQCKRVGESDEVEMIVSCTTGFWARALYRLMDTLRKEHRETYEKLMSCLIEDDLEPEEIEFIQALAGGKRNDKRRNL